MSRKFPFAPPQDEDPDWKTIELEVRAGSLSIKEIGRRYGVPEGTIRSRIKKHGWKRSLSEEVRKEIQEQLVRDQMTAVTEDTSDEEVVATAAKRGAEIVGSHRRDISRLRSLSQELMERLQNSLATSDEEALAEIGMCLGPKETPAEMLEKLTRTTNHLVKLERQAYNLDEPKSENDGQAKLPRNILVQIANQIREKKDEKSTVVETDG